VQLSIVIPALNEEGNISELIASLHEVVPSICPQYEVIVIDGGSVDKTREMARMLNTTVIVQKQHGYGGALREGFEAARGDYILTLDGDLSHSPNFIPQMWSACKEAEVVVASRYIRGGSAHMPLLRRLLSRILNKFFAVGLSLPLKDISSGFRLYRSSLLRDLQLGSTRFDILQEIIVKCYAQGWKIAEVPFHYLPRKSGHSHVRLLKFGLAYLRTFRRMWGLRNSIRSADYDYRAFDSRIPLQRYWQRCRYKIVCDMSRGARSTLDIGCGSSRILSGLDNGIGLDIQMTKLRFIRSYGKPLVNAAINALPFKDNAFDCVVCSEVIEHIPSNSKPFQEMSRVLQKGGKLILGTPDYGSLWWRVIERLYDVFAPGGYAEEHITRYTRRSLTEVMEQLGFAVERVRYIGRSEMILSLRKK